MRILNFGSLNIDNVYAVDHFIRPGETMSSLGMEVFCGGKGLNQSIAMARAGAQVWHAGAVGRNDGKKLLELLAESGVNTDFVRKTDGVSGHTIIQVDKNGQNCILLFGGANQEITPGQVDETLAHFEEGDILLLQNEINGLAGLIKKAAEKGMKIYLNPSPVTGELLELPLELVDCFILNEIEGADICGQEAKEEEIPQLLHEKYPRAVILLTLGSRGCIYYDGENRYEQPAFCVEAVDTTAAGDTFTGYFIASAVKGNSVPDALLKAAKAAAITVMGKGAAPSIPWDKQVEEDRL